MGYSVAKVLIGWRWQVVDLGLSGYALTRKHAEKRARDVIHMAVAVMCELSF